VGQSAAINELEVAVGRGWRSGRCGGNHGDITSWSYIDEGVPRARAHYWLVALAFHFSIMWFGHPAWLIPPHIRGTSHARSGRG